MMIAGADVFRFNFSHGEHDWHSMMIDKIRKIAEEEGKNIALMGDLQGPKIRIGEVKNGEMFLNEGEEINISCQEKISDENGIYINHTNLPSEAKIGEVILINDGKLKLRITSIHPIDGLKAMVEIGGFLSSRKGVNLPDTCLNVKSMTDKDHRDLAFILQHQFEWLALSFVRTSQDISELRKAIAKTTKKQSPAIIAKIEKPEAVKNFDSILRVCDGIMIARGDLGVEVPFELLPVIQKSIIHKTIPTAKPVIVATQMLEGMMTNTTPSRAEINDVANSVMDGADALMLSGETSSGKYPGEAVAAMERIILKTEEYKSIYHKSVTAHPSGSKRFISDNIISAAVDLSKSTAAKAIVIHTFSGYTARMIAAHRPESRIFIFSDNQKLLNRLNLQWGIEGCYFKHPGITEENFSDFENILTKHHVVSDGDLVVHVSSVPPTQKGKSNMILLHKI
jgi:pyruvate kinase